MPLFDLQGHRGARGLKPENTLPAFEVAFDVGVTTIETDVHLTSDGIPVLFHDAVIGERLCGLLPGSTSPAPSGRLLVRSLTLEQVRGYRANLNPDPRRFPQQDDRVTPLAQRYAEQQGLDCYAIPALTDLFAFAEAYAGELGRRAGKTKTQQERSRQIRFDLEFKRVPGYPAIIGDSFDGTGPALLEHRLVEQVRAWGMIERTLVRSFDHRSVRAVRQLEPRLTASVLVAETAPVAPAQLARQADAQVYCPAFEFLDLVQVRQLHAEGVRVVPWTVNDPADWQRLLEWGVDGLTTDYPDQLATFLQARGITF
jgi:glycerophosphoryl diester phosphodiesterase